MLITRCGCSRLLDIDIENREYLLIPMSPVNQMPSMAANMNDALEIVSVQDTVRKFKLWDINDYFYLKGGERVWIYRETV